MLYGLVLTESLKCDCYLTTGQQSTVLCYHVRVLISDLHVPRSKNAWSYLYIHSPNTSSWRDA